MLERVALPFSRGYSQLRDQIQVSCIAGRLFITGATHKTHKKINRIGLRATNQSFLDDSVVNNPPANAEDTSSILALGRPHRLQSKETLAAQVASMCSRAQGTKTTGPSGHDYRSPRTHAKTREQLWWEAHALPLKKRPCSPQTEKNPESSQDSIHPKTNDNNKKASMPPVRGACNFLSSVSSQQKFEAMDVKAPGVSQLSDSVKAPCYSSILFRK